MARIFGLKIVKWFGENLLRKGGMEMLLKINGSKFYGETEIECLNAFLHNRELRNR